MYETRATAAKVDSKEGKIRGVANPAYDGSPGTEYVLWDDGGEVTVERFAVGAFDDWLATNPNILCTFNHNRSFPLGRTTNGKVKVWGEKRGLMYEASPPLERQDVRDLMVSIERGDVEGSSISFRPVKVEWVKDGGKDVRLIRKAEVGELGPVTDPAYGSSTAFVRSDERSKLEQERDDYRAKLETEKRLQKLDTLHSKK